jgi:hypothetical protein
MSSHRRGTDWKVRYRLSEPCHIKKKQDSPTVELVTDYDEKSKCKRITEFIIRINRESKEKEVLKRANQQAKRLTDIITFKREKRVTYHRIGLMKRIRVRPRERWRIGTETKFGYHNLKSIELDLTDSAIAQKMAKDEDINHRLHHASIAIGAEELQLPVSMFTEFFQVIEENNNNNKKKKKRKLPKYYHKYKALRDAISHRQLKPTEPRAAMQQVNLYYRGRHKFEFTPTHEFNYNSEKNITQLKSEASKLKKRALSYINKKM